MVRVEKWQALGNDYLILDREELPWNLTPARVKRLCDPHFGLGSDGICELSPPDDEDSVARLAIYNPDGSRAELSGNGVREAALYLHSHGRTAGEIFSIETDAGLVKPEITGEATARVAMGKASTHSGDFPSGSDEGRDSLEADGREFEFQHVSIGNPQCAIEVESGLEALELSSVGPAIENHELFPNRTNVSFWSRVASEPEAGSQIRARIFERGVGETLSSGTGATGAAVAASLAGVEPPIEVRLDGGSLLVEIDSHLEVHLTGWAVPVYTAEVSGDLLQALASEVEPPRLTGNA